VKQQVTQRRVTPLVSIVVATLMLAGCSAGQPVNPSFPLTVSEARTALEEMDRLPIAPARPVVVAGGIIDPGFIAPALARRLQQATADDAPIISVSFFGANSFDACRDRLIAEVERAWPSDGGSQTIEVDVVGCSMGGLVARHAARPRDHGRCLAVRRLFTIATPHRGASLAGLPTFDQRAVDMRAGSPFLAGLEAEAATYELFAYTRLDDAIVGEENAAPPGRWAWWVPNQMFEGGHLDAWRDPRILADLCRRLRGEPTYATEAPAPVPGTSEEVE